jgi:hypothetical protein
MRHWKQAPNWFLAPCLILHGVKKAAARLVCVMEITVGYSNSQSLYEVTWGLCYGSRIEDGRNCINNLRA